MLSGSSRLGAGLSSSSWMSNSAMTSAVVSPSAFLSLWGNPILGRATLGMDTLERRSGRSSREKGVPLSCSLSRAHPLRISAIHAMPKAISREMNNKNSQIREDPTGLNRVVNLV